MGKILHLLWRIAGGAEQYAFAIGIRTIKTGAGQFRTEEHAVGVASYCCFKMEEDATPSSPLACHADCVRGSSHFPKMAEEKTSLGMSTL